jgi:transposase-like protein
MVYCPMCGSPRLRSVIPQIETKYQCPDCGYQGAFVIEDGEMAKELRRRWANGE